MSTSKLCVSIQVHFFGCKFLRVKSGKTCKNFVKDTHYVAMKTIRCNINYISASISRVSRTGISITLILAQRSFSLCIHFNDHEGFWTKPVQILMFSSPTGYLLTYSGFPLLNWGIFYRFL